MNVPKSDLVKELMEQKEAESIKEANELVERIGSVERTDLQNKVGKAMFYGNLAGLMASTAAYICGTLSGNYFARDVWQLPPPHPPGPPPKIPKINEKGHLNAIIAMFFLATTAVSSAWEEIMEPYIVKVNEEIYGEDPTPESVVKTYKKLKSLEK